MGAKKARSATTQTAKEQRQLEAKIRENPDDAEAYLVYADYLQTQGDPRGELIMLQHAGKTKQKEAKALLKKHQDRFLGKLADYQWTFDDAQADTFEWHLGFIRSARFALDTNYVDDVRKEQGIVPEMDESERDPNALSITSALNHLLNHPSGMFLQELNVPYNMLSDGNYYANVTKVLAKHTAPVLRRLRFGEYRHAGARGPKDSKYDYENSWTQFGDQSKLWPAVPRLARLVFQGTLMRRATLGKIDLPNLEHAEFLSGGTSKANLKSIANANWPKLRYLDVWLGSSGYGFDGKLQDLEPILNGVGLPKLKHLGLMNAELSDELAAVLPHSKILPKLEELSLALGTLSDAGAETLAKNKKAFAHLKMLDLEVSFLTRRGKKLVKDLCKDVRIAGQREPFTDSADEPLKGRYVSVGE